MSIYCPSKGSGGIAAVRAKNARILDADAGTGLVGEILYENGYSHLEAMDISAAMLEKARQKNVYGAFHQKVMGEPLGFKSDSFVTLRRCCQGKVLA